MNKEYGREVLVHAPAKVNVYLRITGKRSDGYHDLETVMQKVDLCDTLQVSLTEQPGIRLSCPGSDLPEDESNIVWKAAESFLDTVGQSDSFGVSIILQKTIPVAAGLGGGSSDAASLLTALNRLTRQALQERQLLDMAVKLGADVPFFVVPHSAVFATGIGDRMKPVAPLTGCAVLLVNPGFSVSTAWVYKNFRLTRTDKNSNLSNSPQNDTLTGSACPLFNDLESVTVNRYPEIAALKEYLIDNGASQALMSGSGPTVFALFENGDEAIARCADQLKDKYGRGVFITRPAGS